MPRGSGEKFRIRKHTSRCNPPMARIAAGAQRRHSSRDVCRARARRAPAGVLISAMPKVYLPCLVATALMVAAVRQAAPQRPTAATSAATPSALPVPLVTALLDAHGISAQALPEFFVGALPAWYPKSLVPPGPVRVVGSMLAGNEIFAV